MNPRAAINDLLPFQGSPFSHLGISPKCLSMTVLLNCCSLTLSRVKRREWDSNPRALADKRFSRPPRYDHFDISPYIIIKQKKRFAHQELSFTQEVVSVSAKRILSLKPFCVNKIFYFFQKLLIVKYKRTKK